MNPPPDDSAAPMGPWPWGWPPGNRPDDAPPRSEDSPSWTEPEPEAQVDPEQTPEPESEPEPESAPRAEPAAAATPLLDSSNPRFWAVACHLSGLLPVILGVPFLGPIAPLVLWRMKRDQIAGVDVHGREALNFQLNVLFWTLVPIITCVGAPIALLALAADVVLSIIAAVSASNGDLFRYPAIYRAVGEDGARGRVV